MYDPIGYESGRGEPASAVALLEREVPEYAVVARGLVRRYGKVTAVDGIDLSVRRGEIYGFLGPNGAGKSTAVRVLCTLLKPHEGIAFVAGHDVARHPQD